MKSQQNRIELVTRPKKRLVACKYLSPANVDACSDKKSVHADIKMCQMVARDTFLISPRYLQNVVMVASIYTTVVVALER